MKDTPKEDTPEQRLASSYVSRIRTISGNPTYPTWSMLTDAFLAGAALRKQPPAQNPSDILYSFGVIPEQ